MKLSALLVLLCFALSERGVVSLAVQSRGSAVKTGGGGFGASNKSPLVHTPDTSETTLKLVQFLKAQKSKGLTDIETGFHESSGLRGLFSIKKFKKGQMMCQIPSDCALALSDPNKNDENAPTLAQGGANFISMYWKNEKARQLWAPYLDTLPVQGSSQFDPTPDFFGDEELELLEFPRLVQQVKERKEKIAEVAAEEGLDADELQFATWMAASRAFMISIATESNDDESKPDEMGRTVTKGDQKSIRVMVPFIDLANHNSEHPNAKLTLIDPEKDEAWFALEATRPIAAGKEIVISYGNGAQSSVEILLNYGFVPDINKIDKLMLKKGGDDSIDSLDGWTTTLEEDKAMLAMAEDDETLKKILTFRIKLKESYSTD